MGVFNSRLTLKTIVVGSMAVNCYILHDKKTRKAFIIDPGEDFKDIKKYLDDNGLTPLFIIHTHGHIDHIAADKEFDLPIYIHKLDKDYLLNPDINLSNFLGAPFKLADKKINTLKGNDKIKFAGSQLAIMHTPGHTPGGICIRLDNAVFTGDTLFAQGIGRTDFPNASEKDLINSIKEKLFSLDDSIVIYPGHGEPSTIGKEKISNPFLIGV